MHACVQISSVPQGAAAVSSCSSLEHRIFSKELCYQVNSLPGWGCGWAIGRDRRGEGQDGGLPFAGDLRVGDEGQGDSHLRACSWLVGEGGEGHGLAEGGQHSHHALWVTVRLVLVLVVMVMVLVLVQVSVLVVVVQGLLVVVLVSVRVSVVLVVLVGDVAAVVMRLGVVGVNVVVSVPVVMGVVVRVRLAGFVVVRVVMIAALPVCVSHVVLLVALGVVVHVVVGVPLRGIVGGIVTVVHALGVGVRVAVVCLSSQQVEPLFILSSLRLIDLALNGDVFTTRMVGVATLAMPFVSKLALH